MADETPRQYAPERPPAGTIVTCKHQSSPHVLNADDRWCTDPVPVRVEKVGDDVDDLF
jgi:hypothetical protein